MRFHEKPLGLAFFRREADKVARALIGCVLVRNTRSRRLRARIVETEAYLGPHDLASHTSKGRTARTEIMFGPAGRAYVYFIYGMHEMLNVVTGDGTCPGQAVLIRAAEPISGWEHSPDLSGPAKLTRVMEIDRSLNGVEITADALHFEPRAGKPPRIEVSARIGVDYAGDWKEKMLRFFDAQSTAVSVRKRRDQGVRQRGRR